MLVTLLLATAPLAAQPVSPETSSLLAPPCTSARAVHDMRCPNYTGFTRRVGGADTASGADTDASPDADTPGAASPGATGLKPSGEGSGPRLGLRPGRDLQRGVASWYGPGFHGRTTANGEKFDMHELTAAHKTLPFGTRVLVHNPRTGKQVVVRINDRGPYARDRVIDLSKAAASAVGLQARGHDTVVLREWSQGGAGASAGQ
jgi:rare lipoprotein A